MTMSGHGLSIVAKSTPQATSRSTASGVRPSPGAATLTIRAPCLNSGLPCLPPLLRPMTGALRVPIFLSGFSSLATAVAASTTTLTLLNLMTRLRPNSGSASPAAIAVTVDMTWGKGPIFLERTGVMIVSSMSDAGGKTKLGLTCGILVVLALGLVLPVTFGQTSNSGPMRVTGYVDYQRGGYAYPHPSSYTLSSGRITPQSLYVSLATFYQTGGTNRVAEDLRVIQGWYNDSTAYMLSGGRLVTSNSITYASTTYYGGPRGFHQRGGTHVVRATLSLGAQFGPYPGGYSLSGGELIVRDIHVGGGAIFAQDAGSLTHTGILTLVGGHWKYGNMAPGEQCFGMLELKAARTNSTFTLSTGSLARIRFAASAEIPWDREARLQFHNWQGGGVHQIYFGTNRSGLTSAQLAQIRFCDPEGFAAGEYPAKQRLTGEVVPTAWPVVSVARSGGEIVVQWPGGYVLQTATNVLGPFVDVEGVGGAGGASLYRREIGAEGQRYFRVRR